VSENEVRLTLGQGGPVIGAAIVHSDGTADAVIADQDAMAMLRAGVDTGFSIGDS